jgi:hypothetical protein
MRGDRVAADFGRTAAVGLGAMKPAAVYFRTPASGFFENQQRWRRDSSCKTKIVAAAAGALCICAAFLITVLPTSVQKAPIARGPTGTCRFERSGAFERQATPSLQIQAKFIAKPPADAGVQEIKDHLVYSRILARYALIQVYNSSLRRCTFLSEIGAPLWNRRRKEREMNA